VETGPAPAGGFRVAARLPFNGTPGTERHDTERHDTERHDTERHDTERHDTGQEGARP
jgi:hypothetical protein